jgi:hypothetical protein
MCKGATSGAPKREEDLARSQKPKVRCINGRTKTVWESEAFGVAAQIVRAVIGKAKELRGSKR